MTNECSDFLGNYLVMYIFYAERNLLIRMLEANNFTKSNVTECGSAKNCFDVTITPAGLKKLLTFP